MLHVHGSVFAFEPFDGDHDSLGVVALFISDLCALKGIEDSGEHGGIASDDSDDKEGDFIKKAIKALSSQWRGDILGHSERHDLRDGEGRPFIHNAFEIHMHDLSGRGLHEYIIAVAIAEA